jgi:hypothetical protein
MYSKQEASKLREEFWTAFGQYMSPVLSAEHVKINWINYKTGIRYINFRFHADNKKARIAIEITHPDPLTREILFDQFLQLKKLLHAQLAEEWTWASSHYNESGKEISVIYTELTHVNIFSKMQWPELISFFKPRIIALDEFWSSAKYAFEALI